MSATLIGVDLSPSIIAEAEKVRPNLYDETYADDVTAVFREKKNQISMIIAADSYIYFGDLVPLFDAMEVGLVNDGCKLLYYLIFVFVPNVIDHLPALEK